MSHISTFPIQTSVRVVAAVCAFIICLRKIGDFDYWTHLAIGRAFWKSESIFINEPFVLSRLESPLLNVEWLFQLFLYPLHAIGSDAAVSIVIAFFAAASIYILSAVLPKNIGMGTGMVACAYLTATAMVAQFRFVPRPEAAAYVLLAAALILSLSWCRVPDRRKLLALAALFAIWVPLHVTWTLGAVFVASVIMSRPNFTFWRDQTATPAGRIFITVVVLVLMPAGYHVFLFALQVLTYVKPGNLLAGVTEMRPLWEFPELMLPCGTVALAGLGCAWGARDGRDGRGGRLLLWCLAAAAALMVARNAAMALLAMVPGALMGLSACGRWLSGRLTRMVAALSLLLMIVLVTCSVRDHETPWGIGVDWPLFPRDAAGFVKQHSASAKVFNNWDCGGYLAWAWEGRPPTFLDGRLGTPEIIAEHDAVVDGLDPTATLEKYALTTVLLQPLYYNSGRIVPALYWLLAQPEWSLVRASDALVFMRHPLPPGLVPLSTVDAWRAMARHFNLLAQGMPGRPHLMYSRAVAAYYGGDPLAAQRFVREGAKLHPELMETYRPLMPFAVR